MKLFAWSEPFLCISSILALLQVVRAANGDQDANQADLMPGVVALGLDNYASEAIMDVPRQIPVYSSRSDNDAPTGLGSEEEEDTNAVKVSNNQDHVQDWPSDRLSDDKKWVTDPKNRSGPKSVQKQLSEEKKGTTPTRHDVRPQRDPCMVVSKVVGPVSYDVVKDCLDADFDFPENLRGDTVATIRTLIRNFYVFEDLAANPPTGKGTEGLDFLSVDLVGEMEQLLAQSQDSSALSYEEEDEEEDEAEGEEGLEEEALGDMNQDTQEVEAKDPDEDEGDDDDDYGGDDDNDDEQNDAGFSSQSSDMVLPLTHREFHDGISRILSKARDGHLSYDADCFRAFRFQHGFFMSHVVRNGKTVVKVHSVTPYFQTLNEVQEDIFNCDVVTIAGKDAAEYIQDWADKHVSMSKDADIRFNAALATPQYRSGITEYFMIGKFSERFMLPEEKSLAFAFHCPGQSPSDLLEIDVKWVGFYTHGQSKPFKNTRSYYEANCIKSLDEDFAKGNGRSRLEKEQDPEQKTIADLKTSLWDMLSHPSTSANIVPSPSALPSPAAAGQISVTTESITVTSAALTTPSQALPTIPPTSSGDTSKSVDEILLKLDLISSEQLPVVKFYDNDHDGRLGEMNMASATSFRELYRGQHGISALLLGDGKTGIITVRTESSAIRGEPYSHVHPAWAGSLIQAINVLRPQAENVILDLSHNTGGYVCLGLTMIQLFFPERPRLVTNVRLSPLGRKLIDAGGMGFDHFISPYGKPSVPVYQDNYFEHTISPSHRNLTFTDYLSDRCAVTDLYVLQVNAAEESKRNRSPSIVTKDQSVTGEDPYHPWNPENLVILTDGYCGSSCALISNTMHTKFGVKTVVIGGRTPKTDPMSYSTFPGLQVIDDSLLFGEMNSARFRATASLGLQPLGREGRVKTTGEQMHFRAEERESKYSWEENDEDDEDEDDEQGTLYPLHFAHKSRLRLTWRQIYNTGPEMTMFKSSSENGTFEPSWGETDQWDEYTFIPASLRIDYTDHNVHSISNIWADTRDAVWGAPKDQPDQPDLD
ncbi:hypothetical protein EDD21DRAFT_350223 [Dissophora ornata]|nr:hypothetical protein EDD21DRAFT_350223 [Dissophora ornata]